MSYSGKQEKGAHRATKERKRKEADERQRSFTAEVGKLRAEDKSLGLADATKLAAQVRRARRLDRAAREA